MKIEMQPTDKAGPDHVHSRPIHDIVISWPSLTNIVLEHLRHIRGAIDDVRDGVREIKQRAGSLENQYASMSNRLDRMDFRIERIERRPDLADA